MQNHLTPYLGLTLQKDPLWMDLNQYFTHSLAALQPEPALQQYQMIRIHLERQDWETAQVEIERGIQNQPNRAEFYYLAGYCRMQRFDFPGARQNWEKCLEFVEIALKQSDRSDDFGPDVGYLYELLQLSLYRLGQIMYIQGLPEQACRYWQHSFTLNPAWHHPLLALALLLMELGRKPGEIIALIQQNHPVTSVPELLRQLQSIKEICWHAKEPALFLTYLEAAAEHLLATREGHIQYIQDKAACFLSMNRFRALDDFLSYETEWCAPITNDHPVFIEDNSHQGQDSEGHGGETEIQPFLATLIRYHCLGRWLQSPPQRAVPILKRLSCAEADRKVLSLFDDFMISGTVPELGRTTSQNASASEASSSEGPSNEGASPETPSPPGAEFIFSTIGCAVATGLPGFIVKAYDFLDKIAATNQTDLCVGKALYQAGDYPGATRFLYKAYNAGKCDPESLPILGRLFRQRGLFAEAQDCYETALQQAPSRRTYLELSCAYQEEIIYHATNGLARFPGAAELLTERKEALECLSYLNRVLTVLG